MKRIAGLFLVGVLAGGMACAKDWKTGAIIGVSQTKQTSPMMREAKIVMHYTVITDELTLQLDYAFHPPTKSDQPDEPGKTSPPSVALGGATKVAVQGHHAYLLDVNGKEVKMEIKKKSKN